MRHLAIIVGASFTLLAASRPDWAAAVTLDGRLDPGYGAPLAIQTTQTRLSDSQLGQTGYADGSELDGLYGYWTAGELHLFITGNLMSWILPTFPGPLYDQFELFLDTGSGGQTTLLANNAAVNELPAMAGLAFDSGFDADYWINAVSPHGSLNPYSLEVYMATLPAGGGGAGGFLGSTGAAGNGGLLGGSNPGGVMISIDNSNTAGVTLGCSPANGSGVTYGIEIAIPVAAIGSPTGCVRVCVLVDGEHHTSALNQTMPPLPAGSCFAGPASALDFGAYAGDQFVSICESIVSVQPEHSSWGSVKGIYR